MSSKEKSEMNIQAFVRIRPFTSTEKKCKILENNVKDVVVKGPDRQPKTFSFDKVFGSEVKQDTVYTTVVKPMVAEVLAGYNCTVFAYGQTGSGKTFTMMGESDLNGKNGEEAGVIPRALDEIFNQLKNSCEDYFVKVSYLELYNEELIDLLNITTDKNKIRIFEDPTRKGSVIVSGITDLPVSSKEEAFKLIQKGVSRRHTASTLMNEQSSRSHTLFTITVHLKDSETDEDEDYIKIAKLNLVDLAGSENIGRSGAVDKRFREASNINTSLLTLGRVITALVEKTPHVPYRESKLTRLLQDSLGGHTKTSIIATVSPSGSNLEETLSTLDYACRAKFITNKPEINKKIATKHLLKECMEEVERLKRDLQACRDKTGIYIAQENYQNMMQTLNDHNKIVEEKVKMIEDLRNVVMDKEEMLSALHISYSDKCNALSEAKNALLDAEAVVKQTKLELKKEQDRVEEQEYLVKKYSETEKKLSEQATELKTVASIASYDTHKLHDKIERSRSVEKFNEAKLQEFNSNLTTVLLNCQQVTDEFACANLDFNKNQKEKLSSGYDEQVEYIKTIHGGLSQITSRVQRSVQEIINTGINMSHDISVFVKKQTEQATETSQIISESLDKFYSEIIQPYLLRQTEMFIVLENAKNQLGIEEQKVIKKLNEIFEENLKIKEELKNINSVVSNCTSDIAEQIKNAEEARSQALSEALKQKDQLEHCKTEIIKALESMNSCVDDPVYSIIVNQKELLQKCESSAEVTNKQCQQLYNDILCKHGAISTSLLENSSALEKAGNVFSNQASAVLSLSVSAKNKADVDYKEFTTKQLQNFENFEHTAVGSQLQFQKSMNDNLQTLTHRSQHLNNIVEESVEKLRKSMAEHLVQYKEYIEKEDEEFLDAKKHVTSWKESTSSLLEESVNFVNKLLDEDFKHDIPTGGTPQRKDYHFPTDLVATSPAERIIQRYRQERAHLLSKEYLNQMNLENSTPTKEKHQKPNSKEQSSFINNEINNESSHLCGDMIYKEDKENLPLKLKKDKETDELKGTKIRYALMKRN